ncbi:hypothetical protein V6767_20285 [Martelella sp. FLE1502]
MRRFHLGSLATLVMGSAVPFVGDDAALDYIEPRHIPSRGTGRSFKSCSKYTPHIGKRQRARLSRQIAAGQIKMMGV